MSDATDNRFYREADEIPPSPSGRTPYRDELNTTDDAERGYKAAVRLLVALSGIHHRGRRIRPLPTLAGVISQIDNATAGLVKPDELRDEFAKQILPSTWDYANGLVLGSAAREEQRETLAAEFAYRAADAMLEARRGAGGQA